MVRGHSQKGDVFVGKYISRTLRGAFCRNDGEHIGPPIETVVDKQDVGVAPRHDRKNVEYWTLMAMPEPSGTGMEMTGQRTLIREVFRA